MGSGFSSFVDKAEVIGKDVFKIFSGAASGTMSGISAGAFLGPEGSAAGGVVGGIIGAVPGISSTIKDIVHFSHHADSSTSRGGPTVQQLISSAPATRAATFAAMADDKGVAAFRRAAASGMTAGGAFVSSGMSRVPGAMAQGALNGIFTRAPGVNPRTALLLGNGAMRRALSGGLMSGTSQVVSPMTDAVYGYAHAMAGDMYSRGAGGMSATGAAASSS